jgi:hypothetical protein
MSFNLNEAIKIANQAVLLKFARDLTDVEVIVFKGAWAREEYDQIAAKNQYATSYISQDVAPKLWKLLTYALGEKVKKSNFKEALKRRWEQQFITNTYYPQKMEPIPLSSIRVKQDWLAPELYVDRPVESICYETLLQPGSLIRIKAPKLMGKSSLMERLLAQLAAEGYRAASLSLKMADRSTHLTNLNKFLRWFCLNFSRELNLPNQINTYWDEEGVGAKVSCTTYLEEHLLEQENSPLILCLDDVDALFPYPEVYEDFFGLLRSWYEKARSRQTWKKLRLVIAHSTDVYIRLNINQSPFNVGLPIELPELTREEVQILANKYGFPEDLALVYPLMDLVGGHPYLLQQAFSHLKSYPNTTLNQLLVEAPTDAGIYSHHLREHWLNLQQEPKLIDALQIVINDTKPVRLESILAYQLQSLGLVKLVGNEVEPRCQLYRNYFGRVMANSPVK